MKYRQILTGAVLVPTFIFLSGIGIPDESWAGSGAKSCPSSGKTDSSSDKKLGHGVSFEPSFKIDTDFKSKTNFTPPVIQKGGLQSQLSQKKSPKKSSSKTANKSAK